MIDRRRFLSNAAVATAGVALLGTRALAADPNVAKLATVAPEGTPWAEHVQELKTRMEQGSQGRVKIKPFLGSALGDETVTASECKRGAIQLWGGTLGSLASVVPELSLFELPFLFHTLEEADHVIDEVLFDDTRKLLQSRGFTVLFWSENGYRSFGTRFGPVTRPEHLKGRKMRSQENEAHLDMYRALGASPVPIAVTEVLSSLQTGVVDGFDNTPLFSFAASWHKAIKHYSLAEVIYQPAIVVANRAWFSKLSAADQKTLLGDQRAEATKGRKAVRALYPLLIENFRNEKIQVHELTREDRSAFASLCEPVHEGWAKSKGKVAATMLRKAKTALAAFRAKRDG